MSEYEKTYSHNEENWVYDLDVAIDSAIEEKDCLPSEVEIKIGDAIPVTHDRLCGGVADMVVENLQERAYDECGEWSEGYLNDLDIDKTAELSKVIAGWLNKNADSPNCYTVENIVVFECLADVELRFQDK